MWWMRFVLFVVLARAQTKMCLEGDEDCGVCPDPAASLCFNAMWQLSGVTPTALAFAKNVSEAQNKIGTLDPRNVISFNNPWLELHVTLKYFCCLSAS
jgi:hypothetical protein